jgi:chemotaxis signal transduction protein
MNPTLAPTLTRSQTNPTARIRVITFTIGSLTLALRIEQIVKIIKNPEIVSSGTNSFGVAHIGDQEITILDLQCQLFGQRVVTAISHLILLNTATGETLGIPVETVPVLRDIPATLLRVLPESYRRSDTLSMATHVAIVPEGDAMLTLFLMDSTLLNP